MRSWLKLGSTTSYKADRRGARTNCLNLEPLEERQLLSTCHVTRLGDSGGGFGLRGDLRYCINKVNDLPGPDVIDFKVTGTINLASTLPDIDSDIDIQGPGAALLTINAQQIARVLYVEEDVDVRIAGLALTGGRAQNKEPGGGIYNEGSLSLESCSISANTGWNYGGGVYNDGTLWISACSITGNTVGIAGPPYTYLTWGGGIYNGPNGTLEVHNSVVSDNANQPSFSWTAIGAGIANTGSATVVGSTISWNLANPASATTIAGCGGGIYNGGNLLVDSSTVAMNTASGDYYAFGGGICNGYGNKPGGTVTIKNSTIAYNWAFITGFDNIDNPRGGGISSYNGGTVSIDHSTIAENQSGGGMPGYGGGIAKNSTTQLFMRNSILGSNFASNGPDLWGSVVSSGHNLFGKTTGGSGYGSTDLLNVNPLLAFLQDNGGPTQTMALLSGSPAIDAGDNTDAPEWDQRGAGYPRIVNGAIDIGAFEVQSAAGPRVIVPTIAPVNQSFLIAREPRPATETTVTRTSQDEDNPSFVIDAVTEPFASQVLRRQAPLKTLSLALLPFGGVGTLFTDVLELV